MLPNWVFVVETCSSILSFLWRSEGDDSLH